MNTNNHLPSNIRLEELMHLYFSQRISTDDLEELWCYVNDPFYQEQIKALIPDATEQVIDTEKINPERAKSILASVFEDSDKAETIQKQDNSSVTLSTMMHTYWKSFAVAASVIGILCLGTWLYTTQRASLVNENITLASTQDIDAGTVGATLRLSDGRIVQLDTTNGGDIARESGIKVEKGGDGTLVYSYTGRQDQGNEPHTLATAVGQTYVVLLPDGSKVWLNAKSALTYKPNLIEGNKRIVHLSGEAYFEIAKDSSRPFIVKSRGQEVRVLGTHFNINAYDNEPYIATTLLEGSVSLHTAKGQKVLVPAEQAINRAGEIHVSSVNLENIIDWKDGDFAFRNIDFVTAMRKIERWYNVEMVYDASLPKDLQAGGWISRKKKLSSVLDFIESSKLVKFRVEGRKVYVMKY